MENLYLILVLALLVLAPASSCTADEEVYTLTEEGMKKYNDIPPSSTGVTMPRPSPPVTSVSSPSISKLRPYSDVTVLMYMADW